MKTIKIALSILCCCIAVCSQDWSISLSTEAVSRYLWRGQNLHNGPAIQPCIESAVGNWTTGLFFTQNLGDKETKGFAEVDIYSSWSSGLPCCSKCEVTAGFNVYTYPQSFDTHGSAFSTEALLGLAVDVPSAPSLTYYFDGTFGQYLELGLSHELAFGEQMSLSPEATAGYGLYQESAPKGDWTGRASVVGLGTAFTYSTAVDITARILGTIPLNETYERDICFGLAIGYEISGKSKK